jgi:hypothetical protein
MFRSTVEYVSLCHVHLRPPIVGQEKVYSNCQKLFPIDIHRLVTRAAQDEVETCSM